MCDHTIIVAKTDEKAKIPIKAHDHWLFGDAAYDLFPLEDIHLWPGERKLVDTGLKFSIPGGYWVKFHERSGLANKGVQVFGGVIDNGYSSSLKVILYNSSEKELKLEREKAIAQFTLEEMRTILFEEVSEKEYIEKIAHKASSRNENGFGSSDVK